MSPRRRHGERGFTILELLAMMGLLAILFAIGVPMFATARHGVALDSAQESVASVLLRARWAAITSGTTRTVALPSTSKISIRNSGGTELFSVDLGAYSVTIASAGAPFSFDTRGFLSPATAVTFTLTNAKSATKTVTVTPLGKIQQS